MIAAIATALSMNWMDLWDAGEKALELETTYGIEICWGCEVPDSLDCYRNLPLSVSLINSAPSKDTQVFIESIRQLNHILSAYPEDFFRKLVRNSPICFGLASDITGNDPGMITSPGAYVYEENGISYVVLNVLYDSDWDYILNHELSHLIDSSLEYSSLFQADAFYSEDRWLLLNPEDFSYLNRYDGYENNASYEKYPDYFLDAYGTTFATEDRAQVFGAAMEAYLDGSDDNGTFSEGSPMRDKLIWYAEAIREGLDYSNEAEKMPWEWVLE